MPFYSNFIYDMHALLIWLFGELHADNIDYAKELSISSYIINDVEISVNVKNIINKDFNGS